MGTHEAFVIDNYDKGDGMNCIGKEQPYVSPIFHKVRWD